MLAETLDVQTSPAEPAGSPRATDGPDLLAGDLAAAVAAVEAYKPALDAAWAAHNVLDEEWVAMPGDHPDLEDLRTRVDQANLAAHAAQDQYDALCNRILQVPAQTVAVAMEKQRAWYRAYGARCPELGIAGRLSLPDEEQFMARDALLRDLALLDEHASTQAAAAAAFRNAFRTFQDADRDWRAAGNLTGNGRPDGMDDGEWARLNLEHDQAQDRLASAREHVMTMPAPTPMAVADKLAIYYDDHEVMQRETLWLNANDIASIEVEDAGDRMRRDLARLYLDAHRLDPTPSQPTGDDRQLAILSYQYQDVAAQRTALHLELRAIGEKADPVRKQRLAQLGPRPSDDAVLAAHGAVADEFGETEIHDRLERLDVAMDELHQQIEQLRASTLAGLRVKVQRAIEWREADVDTSEIDDLLIDLASMLSLPTPPAFGFDARHWINSYQHQGGDACRTADGGLYLARPVIMTAAASKLLEELAQDEAKQNAVRHACRNHDDPPPKWLSEARADAVAQRHGKADA